MFETNLPRNVLRAFIEEGISAGINRRSGFKSDDLTDEDAGKLREVGKTVPHVAYGGWWVSNNISCGCPAVEAGLSDKDGNYKNEGVHEFAGTFDEFVVKYLLDEKILNPNEHITNPDKGLCGILIVQD